MGIVVYRVGAVVGDVSARDLFCAAGRRVLAAEALDILPFDTIQTRRNSSDLKEQKS
jgi:hypothetical protein